MNVSFRGGRQATACLLPFVVLLLTVSTVPYTSAERNQKISGFVIGHSMYVWYNPFRILFMRDPLFDYSLYPLPPDLSDDDKRKLDRVYYPRTRDLLVDGYDLMVFHSARIEHFIPRQIHDLDQAFREEGMVAMLGLSLAWDTAWVPTILSDLVPVSEHEGFRFQDYTVDLAMERDPVLTPFLSLGIEKVVGTQITIMTVRQGAVVWGNMRPQGFPWLVSWRPGGTKAGMQWVVAHIFDSWWSEENNQYSLDVSTNMILYSLGEPLINDIHARREARRLFANLQTQKSIILSMMEWAESFGAKVTSLNARLTDLEGDIDAATFHYLEQNYPETISSLESVSRMSREISNDAVCLKDEALFWIYLIEWLTVASTTMVCCAVVWILMVRRRLYREAGLSRLSSLQ